MKKNYVVVVHRRDDPQPSVCNFEDKAPWRWQADSKKEAYELARRLNLRHGLTYVVYEAVAVASPASDNEVERL